MDLKKLGKKLLFPPVWLLVILTAVSAAALTLVFVKGWTQTVLGYISYVLAFYTLCAVSAFCVLMLPRWLKRLKERIYGTSLGNRYMTDGHFRTKVSMYISFGVNLLFVGVNLLLWYTNRSWWFVVLAIYYGILAALWSLLAGYVRSHETGAEVTGEWKRSRICAWVLLSINLFLSGAVLMILYQNKGFHYNGILIYIMALFTFYSTIQGILDIIKYRKRGSPVMTTAKAVSLCATLVSMLNLETAMFAQFGAEMPAENQRIFIILTGAGVSITVITLSVILIVRATKEIRREKYGK